MLHYEHANSMILGFLHIETDQYHVRQTTSMMPIRLWVLMVLGKKCLASAVLLESILTLAGNQQSRCRQVSYATDMKTAELITPTRMEVSIPSNPINSALCPKMQLSILIQVPYEPFCPEGRDADIGA